MKILLLIVVAITFTGVSFSDQEAGNTIYVTGNGAWFAKSIPR